MRRNPFMVLLVMLIFVVISLVTNILDPLMPNLKESFRLTGFAAGFMAFAFFLAYGVMSIPAGMLAERAGPKAVIVAAFVLAFLGSLGFALRPTYLAALPSLFIIAVGFAMLQVVINPLLRIAGGEEHFAFFGNLSQLVFAGASWFSPHVYTYLVRHLQDPSLPQNPLTLALARVVPPALPWVSLYWVFALVTAGMVAVTAMVRMPPMELKEEERVGSVATLLQLLRSRTVILFFLGVFCYVGTEQGLAIWISQFLKTYHHVDPLQGGQAAVSAFWGLLMAGCAVGLLLLKLFDSRAVLVAFGSGAVVTLLVGLFGSRSAALACLPLMGFWCSIMWPVVSSLALNSIERHHGSFAGILCTGIVGGAFLPPIIGWAGDHLGGLRFGMLILLATLGYVISVGIWARPLIANATIPLGKD